MSKQRGSAKQNEYISQYNKLHEIITTMSMPYFQKVANREINDPRTSPEDAQRYLDANFIAFMKAIHTIAKNNYSVERKISEFYQINELRNSLSHNDRVLEIIEPTDYAINMLRDTIETLTNPMKVGEYLEISNKIGVETVDVKTPVLTLFNKIQSYKYTQFPVFDGENFKGLISDNGITYWIVNAAIEEKEFQSVELSDTTVEDLFSYEEEENAYQVVQQKSYLYDVLKLFDVNEKNTTSPILLITNDDEIKSKDSIIGVLTGHDYLNISKYAL